MIKKIISGGQFGSDIGGLEAARDMGIETGGYCPNGYITERGVQKELLTAYNLIEAPYDPKVYPKRTMMNVDSSDGTLAIRTMFSIGTDCTIGYAKTKYWRKANDYSTKTNYKPIFVLESFNITDILLYDFETWIIRNNIQTLNVAGSRESKAAGIQENTRRIVKRLIESI